MTPLRGREGTGWSRSLSCRRHSGSVLPCRAPASRAFPARMPRRDCSGCRLSCAVPDLKPLDGGAPWAEVRLGWNAGGLGIAVVASGLTSQHLTERRPEGFAVAQFWVDTRDTRNVSRATKFCHRFVVRLDRGESRGRLEAQVTPRPIPRAVAEAPMARSDDIPVRAELSRASWGLELFLPAQVLNGFDPETNRRLGFAYQITDFLRDDQFLGVGRDFPIAENPSLVVDARVTRLGASHSLPAASKLAALRPRRAFFLTAARRSAVRIRTRHGRRSRRDARTSRRGPARGRW